MKQKVILAATLGNAIWGFSFIFTRIALQSPGATVENFLANRFLIATVVMILIMLIRRQKISFKGKHVGWLIGLMATSTLYFFFETWAISYTNSTFTEVVLSVVPVFTIATGYIFLKEKPSLLQALLCLVPIAGVVIITLAGSEMGVVTAIGVVFVAATCIVSSFYKTCNRFLSSEFSAVERNFAETAIKVLVFPLLALCKNGFSVKAMFAPLANMDYLLPLLALVILSSIIANILVNYSAGYMSVMQLATFGAISTVCSAIGGVVFLNEPMSLLSIVGAVLVVVGVYFVTKTGKTGVVKNN